MTRRKLTVLLLLSAALAVAVAVTRDQLRTNRWREHPDAAFTELTGRALPNGVHASAYDNAMDDNFFHTTHYWLLEGETANLRQVLVGTGFGRSDEDAKWVAPSAADALATPISVDDVIEGYEWELPRNSWFLLLKGGQRAIYVQ